MDPLIWVVAGGAALAGFVQGLSGFGFALTAMSVWAWTVEPRLAAVLAVFGALTGQVLAAVTVRRGFDLRLLAPFVAGGLVGVPLGVALLQVMDATVFKAVIGGLLAIWCPLMLFSRELPRVTAGGRVADAAAGLAGGVFGGLGGLTGAVPTLWCTLRQFDKERSRSVIQNFNLVTLAVTMATYVGTGTITRDMLPLFAIVAPAMLIPTLLGARVYARISEAAFRRIVLVLLTASGAVLLVSSLPRLLAA